MHAVVSTDDVFGTAGFQHVVVQQNSSDSTFGTSGKKIWINGVEKSTGGFVETSTLVAPGTRTFNILGSPTAYDNDNGTESVKYLRYYDSVLTQAEITTLYTDKDN